MIFSYLILLIFYLSLHVTVLLSDVNSENDPKFMIFQAMSTDHESQFKDMINRNRQYSMKHNYSFEVFSFNKYNVTDKLTFVNSLKMITLLKLISGEGYTLNVSEKFVDYFMFLDSDAFVAETEIPLSYIINIGNNLVDIHGNKEECHFISQDDEHVVNGGFFIFRNSSWSKRFVTNWLEDYFSDGRKWMYDQGSLQNQVLHYASKFIHPPIPYNNKCLNISFGGVQFQHKANLCYNNTMTNYGLVRNNRKFGNICLFPRIGVPYILQHHMSFTRGEYLAHGKQYNFKSKIYPCAITWNQKSKNIELKNGSFIRLFNNHDDVYIVLENKKHRLLSQTLYKEQLKKIINVNSILFENLPTGLDIL